MTGGVTALPSKPFSFENTGRLGAVFGVGARAVSIARKCPDRGHSPGRLVTADNGSKGSKVTLVPTSQRLVREWARPFPSTPTQKRTVNVDTDEDGTNDHVG